jgi:hypothetical protein
MAIKKNIPLDDYLGIGSLTNPQEKATSKGRATDDYLGIGALGGQGNAPVTTDRQASDYLGLGTLGGTETGIAVDPVTASTVSTASTDPVKPKLVSTYTDPETGDIIDVYDDKTEVIRKKGTKIKDAQAAAEAASAARLAERTSAFDILFREFKANGLESLVEAARNAIMNEETDAGRLLALRSSPAYQTRFAANAQRVKNGFAAIDEATYLGLEDSFQSILQNYGMPEKYYKRGELGVQQYLADAIAKNIDPVTFEERVMEGQKVVNANKTTFDAAKQFYPTLTDGDFLDYVLNPTNALSDIKRKVTASEIGGAALQSGLTANLARAEELQRMGVDKEAATAGFSTIGAGLQRGSQLASIYQQDPYTQETAESEVFKLSGQQEARKQRQKITGLEKATFGGQSGITQGALARDRAGGY